MLKHLVCLALLTLAGCSTLLGNNKHALKITAVDWSLSEIRSSIGTIIPAGQRTMTPNGREMVSRHFVLDRQKNFKAAGDATERYFAQFAILGERRPYDVEILVTQEKRVLRGNEFVYLVTGYDSRLAKELEKRLRTELTKRREDRNIIDDFRVF